MKFILKKYKVDSLQFAQSNMYYAADYDNYKDMFDQIGKRLAVEQRAVDSIVKIEEKKALKLKAKEKKVVNKDSLKAVMKQVNVDSIRKIIQSKK